jgi:hypothetical protein
VNLEWISVILASLTVGTIAFGHVFVKRMHTRFGTRPAVPLLILGILVLASSTISNSDSVSAVVGILGVTTFWDGIEVFQQEKRVRRDQALDLE